MDVFAHNVELKSRSSSLNIYAIGDVHVGSPSFDKDRFKRYINIIKNDTNEKVVFLLGDLIDVILFGDAKRFSMDNLDDETLTGPPSKIRRNLSNMAMTQAKRVAKMLEPIRDHIIGSVRGNHEESAEKRTQTDLHQIICEELGIRNCGDVGIACISLNRSKQHKTVKVAFMHYGGGGRTAGAGNNSLARAMNIFSTSIVLQGHNHSPAVQRIVKIGTTIANHKNPKYKPTITRDEQIGLNVGSFLKSYAENVNDYAQAKLYNPKEETLYRICVKIVETHGKANSFSTPKLSLVVEELY